MSPCAWQVPSGCNWRHFPHLFSVHTIYAGYGQGGKLFLWAAQGPGYWSKKSAGSIPHSSHAWSSHPLTEICNVDVKRCIVGSVEDWRDHLHHALMAGGGWFPHLVLSHPPHSSASSQGVTYFPLVSTSVFQLVRAKTVRPHSSHRNREREAKKGQQKSKRGLTTTPNPILPQFLLQVPPQAAAQSGLSTGFAFLGKNQAPLIQASSSPAKNNPPAAVWCTHYHGRTVFFIW